MPRQTPMKGRPTAKVRQAGHNLILTIPKSEVDRLGLQAGDIVWLDLCRADLYPSPRPELRAALEASWRDNEETYRYLAEH